MPESFIGIYEDMMAATREGMAAVSDYNFRVVGVRE